MCKYELFNFDFKPVKSYDQRCCMFSKDKKCQFVWDINEIINKIDLSKLIVKYKNVLSLIEQNGGICTNHEYAMTTDITKPCIIALLNGNIEILIDGNHRLYKAGKLKIVDIPCYVIPEELHKEYIIDFNEEMYERVVSDYK